MSAPLTTRDALLDAIREGWHEGGFYARADLAPGWLDGFASVTADALLASGALTDATKLAEDEALSKTRAALRREVGPTGAGGDGDWQPMIAASEVWQLLDALDAALSAQSERAEVER